MVKCGFYFQRQVNAIKIAVESFILSILPPMYLFVHLYYTDVLSITTVLAMLLFNLKQRHNIAAIFGNALVWKKNRFPDNNNLLPSTGLLSVLMRQTNIVWVGMALGCTVMDKIISQTLPFIKEKDKRPAHSYTFRVNIWNLEEKISSTNLELFTGHSWCTWILLQAILLGAKANSSSVCVFDRLHSGDCVIYCICDCKWVDCGWR